MKEVLDRSYYDKQYFDPDEGIPPKSNYERYVDGRKYYLPIAAYLTGEFLGQRALSGQQSVVIDIGCAKGYLVKAFNKLPNIRAYGVDFSEYAISNSEPQVRNCVFLADARHLPFPSDFADLVVNMDMLEHLDDQGINLALSESYRILKPGASLFAVVDVGEHGQEDKDKSHITIQPFEWWQDRFQDFGFQSVGLLLHSVAAKIVRPFSAAYRTQIKPSNPNILLTAVKKIRPYFAATLTLTRPGVMAFRKPIV